MIERNKNILAALERDQTPLLPFELETMQASFNGLVHEQSTLGTLLGEAMSQSSETWHDNAPAEILTADSRVLARRANYISTAMEGAVTFGYPNPLLKVATLGSLVTYHYVEDPEDIEAVYIAGQTRELPEDILKQLKENNEHEIRAITLATPLGRALLGKKIGQLAEYSVNGRRTISLQLNRIEQFTLNI